LETCFGPFSYENHQVELFKLCQFGPVADYQSQFEEICNRVMGLIPPDVILNCFLYGLIPAIRRELAIQKPTSISQAIGLTKLIKTKLQDTKYCFQKP